MSLLPTSRELSHSALRKREGAPLAKAKLTDRQRMAVLLQGCALLGHLERAGWRLERGWRGARIDGAGLLGSVRATPGRPAGLVQDRLRRLLLLLFSGPEGDGRPARESRSASHRRPRRSISGRGQARRLARRLQLLWNQRLVPVRPDHAVTEVLGRATYLWLPAHAAARRSLVAGHLAGGSRRNTVIGPWAFAERLRTVSSDLEELEAELRTDRAVEHWLGGERPTDPVRLAGSWRHWPPTTDEERVSLARALLRLGRYEEALEALAEARSPDSALLSAVCLERLGRPRSARRRLVLAGTGRFAQAERDLASKVEWRIEGRLGSGRSGMRRPTEDRSASGSTVQTRRRGRDRSQAAATWRDLGRARAAKGDLEGAEKALRQGVCLLRGTGAGRTASSVWQGLVEIRLRLGQTDGVARYLREAGEAARLGGDRVSALRIAGLRVRLRLVEGRWGVALELARETLRRTEPRNSSSPAMAAERRLLELLAARALGWLGRAEESRRGLDAVDESTWSRLDSEERALAWLVAGAESRALDTTDPSPIGKLVRCFVRGLPLSDARWRRLESLAPYRAARLIFDLAHHGPGRVPAAWLRRAAEEHGRVGALDSVRRLEVMERGPWRALKEFAESPEPDLDEVFTKMGHGGVRLVWTDGARETELVSGPGGAEEMSAEVLGGNLTMSTPRLDDPLAALFALVKRDFRLPEASGAGNTPGKGGILGSDPGLLKALGRLDRLAGFDLPLLIEGETGTGKELAARRAHAASTRRNRPFLAVNCAALSESLLLSDLFGHVRGAFTGADRDRQGVFEASAGGTVLLDEIGDLPIAAQGKLLRVLQEGEVRRVGESHARRIDVRIIAATHRSLEGMVRDGGFREDLFYRLRVGHVGLPPLRERGDDILELAASFLAERGLHLRPAASRALRAHAWPGNVRELKNVLDVAAAISTAPSIDADDLDLPTARSRSGDIGQAPGYHAQVEEFRRGLLEKALAESGGVRAEAARRLGLSRQAVSYLASRFGLD